MLLLVFRFVMSFYLWLQIDISSVFYKSPHHCVMACLDCLMERTTCTLKVKNKTMYYYYKYYYYFYCY